MYIIIPYYYNKKRIMSSFLYTTIENVVTLSLFQRELPFFTIGFSVKRIKRNTTYICV